MDHQVTYIAKRPGLQQFLNKLSKLGSVTIYSTSPQSVADQIIDQIDPQNKLFTKRLYLENCV